MEWRKPLFGEFGVLGMFFVVSFLGIGYGTYGMYKAVARGPEVVPTSKGEVLGLEDRDGEALSFDSYKAQVNYILTPVLADMMSKDVSVLSTDTGFIAKVDRALEELLKVRLPREAMETQLSLAMFLGKWKNAENVASELPTLTADFLQTHPWLHAE